MFLTNVRTCVAWLADQVCRVMFLHLNNFLQCQHFKLDACTIQILNISGCKKRRLKSGRIGLIYCWRSLADAGMRGMPELIHARCVTGWGHNKKIRGNQPSTANKHHHQPHHLRTLGGAGGLDAALLTSSLVNCTNVISPLPPVLSGLWAIRTGMRWYWVARRRWEDFARHNYSFEEGRQFSVIVCFPSCHLPLLCQLKSGKVCMDFMPRLESPRQVCGTTVWCMQLVGCVISGGAILLYSLTATITPTRASPYLSSPHLCPLVSSFRQLVVF